MSFYTITEQKKLESIADAIVIREQEIFSYDINITNYEAMLLALPQGDWPSNLVQYKNATLDQVPDEHDQDVTDYQYRDRLKYLLKTERLERSKSEKVYQALLSQLPEDQKESLITEAHQRLIGTK